MTIFEKVRQIVIDNSVKDIQELEDEKFLYHVDRVLGLSPWYGSYVPYTEAGVVHMTGIIYGKRQAFCGVKPPYGCAYVGEYVTCLICLAGAP